MPKSREPFVRRILQLRLLLVVNAVILVVLSLSFGREFVRNLDIQNDIKRLEEQQHALATENLQITQLNTALHTESFIERESRLKLGMKKPGEQVVVIQRDQNEPIVVGEEQMEDVDPINVLAEEANPYTQSTNPTKWWWYFFDRNEYQSLIEYESTP